MRKASTVSLVAWTMAAILSRLSWWRRAVRAAVAQAVVRRVLVSRIHSATVAESAAPESMRAR
jgi:hypothetical protein